MSRKFANISTSTLRAMSVALARWRVLRRFRLDIDRELVLRDLDELADDVGGFPCAAPEGWQ